MPAAYSWQRICVFCGSNTGASPAYLEAARHCGRVLADRGLTLVYGGASVGTMGALADAALAAAGKVIGVIPAALQEHEIAHPGLTELRVVNSMHERKAVMATLADAFVALPGGLGTLEEFFEVLTWAQLGEHRKPCGLLNVDGYFDLLLTFLDHCVQQRMLRAEHRAMLMVDEDFERLLARFDDYHAPQVEKWMDSAGEIAVLPTDEGYDRWAEVYDDEFNPLVMLEEPHVIAMLGNVAGLSIVDIGCGTGRHTLRLAAQGARVTAVDFSLGMMERARAKPGAEVVQFVRHDLARPLPFANESFDRVLCCLVLDHIAHLAPFFCELRRICRADGFVLVTVMHPAMELRGVQARFTDPATGRKVSPQSCSHRVTDYVTAALRAGLTMAQLSEHAVNDELAARSPRARKYVGWPLLMLMRMTPIPDRGQLNHLIQLSTSE